MTPQRSTRIDGGIMLAVGTINAASHGTIRFQSHPRCPFYPSWYEYGASESQEVG